MTHKLPPLPYEYSALEPHIDTRNSWPFIMISITIAFTHT